MACRDIKHWNKSVPAILTYGGLTVNGTAYRSMTSKGLNLDLIGKAIVKHLGLKKFQKQCGLISIIDLDTRLFLDFRP